MPTTDNIIRTTQQIASKTLQKSKSSITKFFNFVVDLDVKWKNKRIQIFLWGCVITLFLTPLVDIPLLTLLATFLFSAFCFIVILAVIGSWRDENDIWTWERTKSRLSMYYDIAKYKYQTFKESEKQAQKIGLVVVLLVLSVAMKALPIVSDCLRAIIGVFSDAELITLKNFEFYLNTYFYFPIIVALFIFITSKPSFVMISNIVNEILLLLGSRYYVTNKKEVVFEKPKKYELQVISSKNKEQAEKAIRMFNYEPFEQLLTHIQKKRVPKRYYEEDYRNWLYSQLNKYTHFPVEFEKTHYYKNINDEIKHKRFDIVYNNNVVLELKMDYVTSARQKAIGQINEYSEVLTENEILILVLFDTTFDDAVANFSFIISDLQNKERPVLAIVME